MRRSKSFNSHAVVSDQEIIEKILYGETALFEVLIRRYNSALYKIARNYGFNAHDAEDLVQEAHFTAYMQLRSFEHRSSYKTWLSKILINKCLYKLNYGYFKNERPGNEVIDENTQPVLRNLVDEQTEKKIFSKELARVLENCLQHLPVDYRTVFVLREMEGFNVAETAALLNITPVNVRVRLNRAKAMLQKHLERFYSSIDLYDFNDAHCDHIVRGVYTMIYEQIPPVC